MEENKVKKPIPKYEIGDTISRANDRYTYIILGRFLTKDGKIFYKACRLSTDPRNRITVNILETSVING